MLINVENLNKWFNNLSLNEKVITLSYFLGYDMEEVLNMSYDELISILFVGFENVSENDILENWHNMRNDEKLESYIFYNKINCDNKMDLLNKDDVDTYFLFMDKHNKCDIFNLVKPYSIYDDEYLLNLWNKLTIDEKIKKLRI
jgi:hypothetical protein